MQQKLFLIFFLLFFIIGPVNAQFKKGTRMAGAMVGSAFFNSSSSDVSFPAPTQGYTAKTTSLGINISPSLGWFISGNTVVGLSLQVNPVNQKTSYEFNGTTNQQDKSNSFNIALGGFVRSYFKSSSSFLPFGQVGLNAGISSLTKKGFFYGGSGATAYKDVYDGKSSGGFFVNAPLLLGLTKLLNPHTGLDIYAGYTFSYSKNSLKTTTTQDYQINGSIDQTSISESTTKYTNNGFMVGVGLQVFLERKY